MFEKVEQCPSCGHSKFQNQMICKDYTVSQESFAIVRCTKCHLQFTNPRPDKESIAKYYQSDDYISHSNKSKGVFDILYKIIRSYSLGRKVKLINKLSSGRSLLDYGCGTGHFIKTAIKNSWAAEGVEPSTNAQNEIDNQIKSLIKSSLSEVDEKHTYDIITLWHVLEHVHDLNETLASLKNKLNKNGKLVIAVPNPNSYDAAFFKEYWAAYDVPRHLYHFTKDSITALLNKHKLRVEKTLPMKFDSFYVSLLSHKYKFGSQKPIKSFITGYKSNSYAKKTGEYSSLIYILCKY